MSATPSSRGAPTPRRGGWFPTRQPRTVRSARAAARSPQAAEGGGALPAASTALGREAACRRCPGRRPAPCCRRLSRRGHGAPASPRGVRSPDVRGPRGRASRFRRWTTFPEGPRPAAAGRGRTRARPRPGPTRRRASALSPHVAQSRRPDVVLEKKGRRVGAPRLRGRSPPRPSATDGGNRSGSGGSVSGARLSLSGLRIQAPPRVDFIFFIFF